mgnify:CR=1 FL=1
MRRRKLILQNSRQTLAIDGGPPAVPQGPPPWPLLDEHVRENLLEVYADGSWGRYHGPYVERLEELIAQRHEVAHALSCSSGTIAVELALRGLQVGPGDEVLLAGYDFSGNFRAIEATGARPVLVDLLPKSWVMDPSSTTEAISDATKAIVVSHLHSSIAPMSQIMEIARQHGLGVVEDACQAQGARVEGKVAGTWGDVGVWSFGGSKILTAGRGGAIFTNDDSVAQRVKIFCERGNHAFALSELQAAVLLPQLAKLPEYNDRRYDNASYLYELTADIEALVAPGEIPEHSRPSYYKASWILDEESLGSCPRERFIAALQAEGVALDAGFRGFTRRPESRCGKPVPLVNAERASAGTLVLHHPVLLQTRQVIQQAVEAFHKVASAHANER